MKALVAMGLSATFTVTNALPDDFRIVEIADPNDQYRGRFVEFYTNKGAGQLIGQAEGEDIYLRLYSNGNTDINSQVQLTGEQIGGDGFFIVCRSKSDFATWYPGKVCELESSVINSNGDDVYSVSLQ